MGAGAEGRRNAVGFQTFDLENLTQTLEHRTFKGCFEVRTSRGSGVRDPRLEMPRFDLMRAALQRGSDRPRRGFEDPLLV